MNSKVIKCVAGAGKTRWSKDFIKTNGNGLYLAFTNSVVDELSSCGVISRTIDSLFIGFLLPKLVSTIPLIAKGSSIEYLNIADNTSPIIKNIGKIHIDDDGKIYSGSKEIPITLDTPNAEFHRMRDFPNSLSLKKVFDKKQTNLTDKLREDLMLYLINKHSDTIISFIRKRFDYVIFDEAQDLGGGKEEFAKLLYDSNIHTVFLGDDDQKIMPSSGNWFEGIQADEKRNHSYRCPEDNCRWIRKSLGIDIYGDENKTGGVESIGLENVKALDDGERVLLYHSRKGKITGIIDGWSGPKSTIASSKGSTIDCDIIIVGKTLNIRSYYVAVTRTTKKVYTMIEGINN